MSEAVEIVGIPLVDLPTYRKAPAVGNTPTVEEEDVNVELLLEILEFIKVHPQMWEQEVWFRTYKDGKPNYYSEIRAVEEINSCGTTMCFAGHVALHEGFPPPPINSDESWTRSVEGKTFDEDVSEFASKRLGLGSEVAEELFDQNNDLFDLENMVNTLVKWGNKISAPFLDALRGQGEVLSDEELQFFSDDYMTPRWSY